jgi:hypothetical protein
MKSMDGSLREQKIKSGMPKVHTATVWHWDVKEKTNGSVNFNINV